MKKYLIAGLVIAFDYRYDTYFKNNIEHYIYDGNKEADHTIRLNYALELTEPKDGLFRIFSRSVSGVKSYMLYDEGYKNIDIWIDEDTFTDAATAEYIYSGMIFLELAQRHGLVPIHGSAISYDGEVILFAAPSGTGKSTHAKMWKELYKEHVSWVNDDKPLLSFEGEDIFVYGAPFSGQYSSNSNQKLPLKAIVILQQGVTDKVTVLNEKEGLKHLMRNTLRPQEEKLWDHALQSFETILRKIPMYLLDASLSTNAPKAIKKAIFNE